MGFTLLLAGMIFLVIPTVNIIDLMPDFIGYFLIFAGLSKLKRIDSYMQKAAHYSLIMALVNLSKPAVFVLCNMGDADASASNVTTATLIYMVIELIYGINLMRALFSGFSNLGYQYGSVSDTKTKLVGRFVFRKKKKLSEDSVKNRQSPSHKRLMRKNGRLTAVKYVSFPKRQAIFAGVDVLFVFTLVFFIAHCAFTLIPELTTLLYVETVGGAYKQVTGGAAHLMLLGFCLAVGTVLGVGWYLSMRRYIRGVKGDRGFIEKLEDAYETKVNSSPDVMRSIRYNGFCKLMIPMLLFGGELFLDGCDCIPDIIPAVLLIAVLVSMRDYIPWGKLSFALASVYALLSAVAAVCQYNTFGSYYSYMMTEKPLYIEIYGYVFPAMKVLFAVMLVFLLVMQIKYVDRNFKLAPLYSKGRFIVGSLIMAAAQLISAVGYFTDIISEDMIHFPVKIGRLIFEANVYVSFGSLIIYMAGFFVYFGALDHVNNRLAGKE